MTMDYLFAALLSRGSNGGGGGGFTPTDEQLAAMNSGITATDVTQIGTNTQNITALQTTVGDINAVLEEVL